MANEMTKLLNKIERRIGTKALVLPDEISKDTWAKEVIADDTIPTYSRYFPHKITVYLDRDKTPMDREGYYLLNPTILLQPYQNTHMMILLSCKVQQT